MVRISFPKKSKRPLTRSVLDMTASEARAFLLKPDCYCNVPLPMYLQFGEILAGVRKVLKESILESLQKKTPRKFEGVNYSMLSNKDGRHAWRPFQLIHPALYVSLVRQLTEKNHWATIREQFTNFASIPRIKCLSIPIRSLSKSRDKAVQIQQWWQGIEQASIELALDFGFVIHADITDCYGAIYTHTIPWALHGKAVAKSNKTDKALIGNVIDSHIQDMRHGQTNGIPQGSVLMDLIAEMVLGYADHELSTRLTKCGITEYQILRYRDDYRIFVNNPQQGEAILKELTEVLIELSLKLNTSKTTASQLIIANSLKADKRAWLVKRQSDKDLQKHLLIIHAHGSEFPNAGSLVGALSYFYKRLNKRKRIRNGLAITSIAVDIACSSPRTFPICAAIISKLLNCMKSNDARLELIRKIHRKLNQLPNTGHLELWLQRISHPHESNLEFKEPLCQLVSGTVIPLWNNDWISSTKLKDAIDSQRIVDSEKLESMAPVVESSEFNIFEY